MRWSPYQRALEANSEPARNRVFDLEHLVVIGAKRPPNRGLREAVKNVCNYGPELLTSAHV